LKFIESEAVKKILDSKDTPLRKYQKVREGVSLAISILGIINLIIYKLEKQLPIFEMNIESIFQIQKKHKNCMIDLF